MISGLDRVLSGLELVGRAGNGYKARCPAHSDRSPSLSVREADGGRILVHCFAGCSVEAVVAELGLTMADLSGHPGRAPKQRRINGVRWRELQAAVAFEEQVLFIVKSDQTKGRVVGSADIERAELALSRIHAAKGVR